MKCRTLPAYNPVTRNTVIQNETDCKREGLKKTLQGYLDYPETFLKILYMGMPVNSVNRYERTGTISRQPKKITSTKNTGQYRSRNVCTYRIWYGRSENRTFDPSSGGIGIILNTARRTLMSTMRAMMSANPAGKLKSAPSARISNPKIAAISRLVRTPAAPTN